MVDNCSSIGIEMIIIYGWLFIMIINFYFIGIYIVIIDKLDKCFYEKEDV